MQSSRYQNRQLIINSEGVLTDKEELEAVAIALGRSVKQSAKIRKVSPETCKCQRAAAKAKVGVSSQAEFILALITRGWLTVVDASPGQDGQPMYRRGQLLPRPTLGHYIRRIMFAVGRRMPA